MADADRGRSFFLHFHLFFVDYLDYTTDFLGALVVTVYFPYKGHNKIDAIHTDGLWDVVNQWRGL